MSKPSSVATSRRFGAGLAAIAIVALALRALFPTADPPWNPTVGIVWHDEGAWVHNARNKALFDEWTLDAWNPMYVAPVFTGLEYLAFETFGVGVRQARIVPEALGFLSVILLALGVRRIAGPGAGLIAGALLATNYVYVMWNRAALMEGPMTAFLVFAWYCYVRAETNARWAWPAAGFALLAFFTKAAAAFFVGAVGLDALVSLVVGYARGERRPIAVATLAALVVTALVAAVMFVWPHWNEYRFYNWQMSVTRKPSYDLASIVNRVTWFPVLHDIFTRSWFTLVVAAFAALGWLSRLRVLSAGERLLLLWIGLGALELILHDVGNERRFIFLIPALVAIAAIALGRDRTIVVAEAARTSRRLALIGLPLVLYASYVVAAALVRILFLYEVRPNVRLAAAIALVGTVVLYTTWPRIPAALARRPWTPAAGLAVALLVSAGQLAQFVQWSIGRTYKNYEASIAVGRALPPGTLVHGKLANGLALENTIRPVFVGRGFGNYEDRARRDDVRYVLTYVSPVFGYESGPNVGSGPVIQDVLQAYPERRILQTFEVAETTTGADRAALIDKFGGR